MSLSLDLVFIDYDEIKSNRTATFETSNIISDAHAKSIKSSGLKRNNSIDNLWVSSAIRFFALNDLMTILNWDQVNTLPMIICMKDEAARLKGYYRAACILYLN